MNNESYIQLTPFSGGPPGSHASVSDLFMTLHTLSGEEVGEEFLHAHEAVDPIYHDQNYWFV